MIQSKRETKLLTSKDNNCTQKSILKYKSNDKATPDLQIKEYIQNIPRQWYEKEYKRKTKMHITANKKSSWYYWSSNKVSLDLGPEQSFLRFKTTGLQSWMVWNNFTLFLKESWTQESWSRLWMPTVYTLNQYKLKSV